MYIQRDLGKINIRNFSISSILSFQSSIQYLTLFPISSIFTFFSNSIISCTKRRSFSDSFRTTSIQSPHLPFLIGVWLFGYSTVSSFVKVSKRALRVDLMAHWGERSPFSIRYYALMSALLPIVETFLILDFWDSP